jgi:TonB family protein
VTRLLVALATTGCLRPDASAAVQTIRVPEVAPAIYETYLYRYRWSGSARVDVDLDRRGALRAARIAVSTGNPWLDRAALEAARTASYIPETRNCSAIGGTYAVVVEFLDGS